MNSSTEPERLGPAWLYTNSTSPSKPAPPDLAPPSSPPHPRRPSPSPPSASDSYSAPTVRRPAFNPGRGEQKMPEADWNEENTRIICELFAEQVRAGNRPNTHLNNIGYSEVASKFEQRKRVFYTKTQLKNKWDKLKVDYINWTKLLARGASLGWDNSKGTIAADDDWWKNTSKELPGAKKFRKAGIRNEDHLKVMFEDITSNAVDDFSLAAGSLPSVPDSTVNVENLDGSDNNVEDNDGTQVDHNDETRLDHNGVIPVEHKSPSTRNKKRPVPVDAKKDKKSKTETASLMQAQLKRIAELAEEAQSIFEEFSSQVDSPVSDIQDVMALVRGCGAQSGSDEYFIATELFVSKEQREMFLLWKRRRSVLNGLEESIMPKVTGIEVMQLVMQMVFLEH